MTTNATTDGRSPDTIENPVLGSRMTFLERSADTDGEYVLIEILEAPHAQGPPRHIHPTQAETFEVAEGRLNLEVQGEESILEEGESATVPPGKPHRYWNGSDEQVRATMELRPPGNFEQFLETAAGLAQAGKVNAAGVPNLLQTAVMIEEYWDVFRLVGPPQWLQKPLFKLLAPIGHMLGYRAYYRYSAVTGSEPEIAD